MVGPGDGGACTGTLRSALQDYPAEIINLIKLVLRSSLKEAIVDLFLDTMVECCEKVSGSTFWGCSNKSTMEKMPDQSAKLFAMIINLIKSLDSSVQGLQDNSPVRKRHPRSVLKKVSTLLEKALWQFRPDIVSIVPKLVDPADHTAAASSVLSQVAASGYELSQQEEMFKTLGQLTFGKEVAESVLEVVFQLIKDADDEESFIFIEHLINDDSCNQINCVIHGIRMRLKLWGTDVPQHVLNLMCKTIQNFPKAAKIMLEEIVDGSGPYLYKQGCFSDAYLLFEMLQMPELHEDVYLVVNKSVVSGSLGIENFESALERRYKHRSTQLKLQQLDFSAVMDLCKKLSVSTESKFVDFLRMLCVIFFRIYDDQELCHRMQNTLVENAIYSRVDISNPGSLSDITCNTDFHMSVLLVLDQQNMLDLKQVINVFEQEEALLKKRAVDSEAVCNLLKGIIDLPFI